MKHKKLIIISVIVILIIIVAICLFKSKKPEDMNFEDFKQMRSEMTQGKQEKSNVTLSQTSEIKSALAEEVELHATYYLEEICVEEKQYIEKGTTLIKYTKGETLVAPYNCVIVELNLPDLEGQCLNSHYIGLESTNILNVTMKIDEEQINSLKLGTEAKIQVNAIDKTYTGYVTHIASTASNGKFEVDIEFENDGDIKVGMTSTVEITM